MEDGDISVNVPNSLIVGIKGGIDLQKGLK